MEVNALQQMLSRLRQVQEDTAAPGEHRGGGSLAGGGMVTVKMNGQKQVLEVRIEPEVFCVQGSGDAARFDPWRGE